MEQNFIHFKKQTAIYHIVKCESNFLEVPNDLAIRFVAFSDGDPIHTERRKDLKEPEQAVFERCVMEVIKYHFKDVSGPLTIISNYSENEPGIDPYI